ncbi:inositol 1,4,5-trisphosphate receptor type 1 isoform X1 [Tachysurus ichikawai]
MPTLSVGIACRRTSYKNRLGLCLSVYTEGSAGGSVGARGELSLAEVQCHLDREGASDLVIDLIMNATSDRIFQESILLAIALLEGGNPVIQGSEVIWLSRSLSDCEGFEVREDEEKGWKRERWMNENI